MTQTPTVPTVTSKKLNHSNKLFDEISASEGFEAKPYLDSAGIPTIGKGTTFYEDGRPVTLQDAPITEARADELLNFYVGTVEEKLRNAYPKMQDMNPNEIDAIMSFTYNVGANFVDAESGFETMQKGLNTGDKKIISDAFKLYNKHENPENPAGPLITSEGLTTRRKNEENLFNTPYVINKPKSKYDEFMTDED
jgi:lysozyme